MGAGRAARACARVGGARQESWGRRARAGRTLPFVDRRDQRSDHATLVREARGQRFGVGAVAARGPMHARRARQHLIRRLRHQHEPRRRRLHPLGDPLCERAAAAEAGEDQPLAGREGLDRADGVADRIVEPHWAPGVLSRLARRPRGRDGRAPRQVERDGVEGRWVPAIEEAEERPPAGVEGCVQEDYHRTRCRVARGQHHLGACRRLDAERHRAG